MSALVLEVENSIVVAAPLDRVWEVFVEAAAWPDWCSPVKQVHTAPERWRVGAELSYTLVLLGVSVRFDVTVSELDPSRKIAWSASKWWGVRAVRCWSFHEQDGATRVVDHKRFESPLWPVGWLYPRGVIEEMSMAWLADLAARAQGGGSARLDGVSAE